MHRVLLVFFSLALLLEGCGGPTAVSPSEAVAVQEARYARVSGITVLEAKATRSAVVYASGARPYIVFMMACSGGSVIPVLVNNRNFMTVDCGTNIHANLVAGNWWREAPGRISITIKPEHGQVAWFSVVATARVA